MHQRDRVPVPGALDGSILAPKAVVWVRTGSRFWRDKWHQLQRHWGLKVSAVQNLGEKADDKGELHGYVTVYEVVATPDAMAEISSGNHAVIERWEYAVAGFVGSVATGSGPEQRPHKPKLPPQHNPLTCKPW